MKKWIEFESRLEANQVKRYLQDETDLSVEWPDCYAAGAWFQWEDDRTLHLCCPKDSLGEPWADLVARELCKRFKVSRIGQDNFGWFEDRCPKMLPGYSWIDWLRFQGASDLLEPFVLDDLPISAGQLADMMERDIKDIFHRLDHKPVMKECNGAGT